MSARRPAHHPLLSSLLTCVAWAASANLLLATSNFSPSALAQESKADDPDSLRIVSPKPGKSRIENLEWDYENISLEPESPSPGAPWVAKIFGLYKQPNWTLLQGAKKINVTEGSGQFEIKVPVKGKTASARISGVGPLGIVESEEIRVFIPSLEKRIAQQPPGSATSIALSNVRADRRFLAQTSLGMTSINYIEKSLGDQSNLIDYSAIALTGRIGGTWLLAPPRWELGLTSYGTLTWLSESAPHQIRFLGVNARVGYVIQPAQSRWKFSLVGGAYYTTTFVPGGDYGFQNMLGPQLYPNFRVTLSSSSSLSGYFKFSPVSGGSAPILELANHEMAVGGAYLRDLPGGRTWGFSLDLARIQLKFSLIEIQAQNITAGVMLTL